jgi:hypothetical protein
MKKQITSRLLAAGLLLSSPFIFSFTDDYFSKEKMKYIDKSNMDLTVKPGNNFLNMPMATG